MILLVAVRFAGRSSPNDLADAPSDDMGLVAFKGAFLSIPT